MPEIPDSAVHPMPWLPIHYLRECPAWRPPKKYRLLSSQCFTPLLFETGIFRRLARSHHRRKCSKPKTVAAFTTSRGSRPRAHVAQTGSTDNPFTFHGALGVM